MSKSSRRRTRRASTRPPVLSRDPFAFPILAALVAGFVVLGVFQYALSVAVASAVVAGILVWRWWQRIAKK